jgi:murein DD-endopeptidase MepM/ murein hydrolase activator NlpD
MPIHPATRQDWQLVPPLDLPLRLRLETGRFGALRPKPLERVPPCATGQVIPADDPRNPTGDDVHFTNQIHEAVDLAADAGGCVFAAYSGRVVEVEANPAETRGNVTIDHHPRGLGYVTKYNHVTDIAVSPGEFLQKGAPFAAVSAQPEQPTLHFELWAVVDRPSAGDAGWPGDTDLVPVDPTRPLYDWERRTAEDQELPGGPFAPQSIGLTRLHSVPFFTANFPADSPTY